MSLRHGAPRQNVFLLKLFLAGSVPQLDVQGVSPADLTGQRAWNRDATQRTRHRLLGALKQPAWTSVADNSEA